MESRTIIIEDLLKPVTEDCGGGVGALFVDDSVHSYMKQWRAKGDELLGSGKIAQAKKAFFAQMEAGIPKLRASELAKAEIKIYKEYDYTLFDTRPPITIPKTKRDPTVTAGKILWEKEGSDKEMVFQVNFASQEYGGGTFRGGFVQEEIKNVLSTTSSILTASKSFLKLWPRNKEDKPTPVVIVGQIKDFTGTDSLPYGWKEDQWKKSPDLMIKPCDPPTTFNELAIAANDLGGQYGGDTKESVESLFNNALAGFKLAKEVADEEGKSCKIKTGLFGAGAFHNSPEFSIVMQYLAARIADVEIEFCGIELGKKPCVQDIFSRVDEMISSEMSLDGVVKELLENWKSTVDGRGWRAEKGIPRKVEDPSAKAPKGPSRTPVPASVTPSTLPTQIKFIASKGGSHEWTKIGGMTVRKDATITLDLEGGKAGENSQIVINGGNKFLEVVKESGGSELEVRIKAKELREDLMKYYKGQGSYVNNGHISHDALEVLNIIRVVPPSTSVALTSVSCIVVGTFSRTP